MERLRHPLVAVLLAASLASAGCSSSDNPAASEDQLTSDDVTVITEDFTSTLAGGDEGLVTDWTDLQLPGSASTVSGIGGVPAVQDTGQQNRGSLTVTRVRVFYDADGNAYDRYDPETTVAMDRMLSIEGTRTNMRGTRTATLLHTDSTRITGIAPTDTVRTLNGQGSREVSSSFTSMDSSRTRSFEGNYTWTVSDLRIERGNPYPLSGEVAVTAYRHRLASSSDNQREVTVELSFTITFDGTNIAVMTLSDGTVYTIDLDEARLHTNRR